MIERIQRLREIILENEELNDYYDRVNDNWNNVQLHNFILEILRAFTQYHDNPVRPGFYTKLQTLFNIYNDENRYI